MSKQTEIITNEDLRYPVFTTEFKVNGFVYSAGITLEMYPEEDGLDATGAYLVMLQTPRGTKNAKVYKEGAKGWTTDSKFMGPAVLTYIALRIEEFQNNGK